MKLSKEVKYFLICYGIVLLGLYFVTQSMAKQELLDNLDNKTFEMTCEDGSIEQFTLEDDFVCGQFNEYTQEKIDNGEIVFT